MTVTTNISRHLDNNFVQVDVESKKAGTRYYKVPQDNADSFCASYKKNDKKMSGLSNISFVFATVLGCAIASPFTRSLSTGARMGIGILVGAASAIASIFGMANLMQAKNAKILKQFNAEEIVYENKKLPI